MTRPVYETKADLAREKEVAEYIEGRWKVTAVKLAKKYYVDFMLFRDKKATAVAEIKCRPGVYIRTYPTYILSLAKWNRGVEYFFSNGLKFVVIVKWEDGTHYYKFDIYDHFNIEMGGRTDRGDPEDIEPVIHIPIDKFKTIEGG